MEEELSLVLSQQTTCSGLAVCLGGEDILRSSFSDWQVLLLTELFPASSVCICVVFAIFFFPFFFPTLLGLTAEVSLPFDCFLLCFLLRLPVIMVQSSKVTEVAVDEVPEDELVLRCLREYSLYTKPYADGLYDGRNIGEGGKETDEEQEEAGELIDCSTSSVAGETFGLLEVTEGEESGGSGIHVDG